MAGALLGGCIADVDWLANGLGASTAFAWRDTYSHSILAAAAFSFLISAVLNGRAAKGRTASASAPPSDHDTSEGSSALRISPQPTSFGVLIAASLIAASLHIAMDACQSDGVMLLWPFSTKRFAADWLPGLDPWILGIFILAIALPGLIHLVNAEIGSRSKKPRGRAGAILGLTLVFLYIGARGILHSDAVALMESRSFHGEPARRAAAFPEPLSPITWHGIAETESALNQIDVNLLASASFDADASLRLYKPEASPALDAARNTRVAKLFLSMAQIPRANVEKSDVGYVVILRDMRYAAAGEAEHEIAALIELDPEGKVTAQELVWARDLRR